MTWPGIRAVRDALADRHEDLERAFFVQATVTAVGTKTVTVLLPGAAAGDTRIVPRLKSYSAPAVGEVVWLAGPPGSWVALGALA